MKWALIFVERNWRKFELLRCGVLITELHRYTNSSLLSVWTSVKRLMLILKGLHNNLGNRNPCVRSIIV